MPHQRGIKPVAQNKKAYHDYFVEETYECGLCLKGTEVKSMRQGRVNLKESFAMVRGTEVFAEGMHISPYEQGSFSNGDPLRPKKLLLHKSEIRKLSGLVSRPGLHADSPEGLPQGWADEAGAGPVPGQAPARQARRRRRARRQARNGTRASPA